MSKSALGLLKNTLVLGGMRSGKSEFAESIIENFGKGLYIATAVMPENDQEMATRILKHKKRRGANWTTVEEPLNIVEVIEREVSPSRPILVDCLTLWLSNLMYLERCINTEVNKLKNFLEKSSGPVIFVSNEVGLGIISENEISRKFGDHMGYVNQVIGGACSRVIFVAAGISFVMKDQ